MARKLSRTSFGVFPAAVTLGDLVAGGLGAVGGGVLFALLQPVPLTDGGSLPPGEAQAGGAVVAAWLLALVAYAGFGFFSLVLARVDLRTHTLPNGLLAWATLWTIPLLSLASAGRGDGWMALGPWIAAALITFLALLLWLHPRGLVGGGDLKLMPVAVYAAVWGAHGDGWLIGCVVFLGALLAGFILGGIVALASDRAEIAAGPLALGASWITFAVTQLRAP